MYFEIYQKYAQIRQLAFLNYLFPFGTILFCLMIYIWPCTIFFNSFYIYSVIFNCSNLISKISSRVLLNIFSFSLCFRVYLLIQKKEAGSCSKNFLSLYKILYTYQSSLRNNFWKIHVFLFHMTKFLKTLMMVY